MIRSELDPIKDKMYDYSLDTAREEHLYNDLQQLPVYDVVWLSSTV